MPPRGGAAQRVVVGAGRISLADLLVVKAVDENCLVSFTSGLGAWCCDWARATRDASCPIGLYRAILDPLIGLRCDTTADVAIRSILLASSNAAARHLAEACGVTERALRARCAKVRAIAPAKALRWARLVRRWYLLRTSPRDRVTTISTVSEIRALRRTVHSILGSSAARLLATVSAESLVQSLRAK